mmetsp:Transcript_31332/g.56877  ORF Transcript_31332/g.56877 Transcript_31332/m.56877 type:complete len:423 (-) Transcript_31332:174-1442(-)
MGIDIGPGVLHLAGLGENGGDDLVEEVDHLEEVVVGEVLLAELALAGVAGVGLTEDGVAVSGDDLAGGKGVDDVLLDLVAGGGLSESSLHLVEPAEDLLVGEAMEGTGEAVDAGGEGEVGVGEGRANEVAGVGRDVATLVVGVDGLVETHHLDAAGIVVAHLVGEVGGPIELGIGLNDGSVLVGTTVDNGSELGKLGNEIHGVLVDGVPVLGLVDAGGVGLGELGVLLESHDTDGELGHGVGGGGKGVDDLEHVLRDLGAGTELLSDSLGLLGGGDLVGHEEPEETLRDGLATRDGGGELGLELGDAVATEADALFGVEEGGLPEEAGDTAHTTDGHVNGDVAEGLGADGLLKGLEAILLSGDELSDGLLKISAGRELASSSAEGTHQASLAEGGLGKSSSSGKHFFNMTIEECNSTMRALY